MLIEIKQSPKEEYKKLFLKTLWIITFNLVSSWNFEAVNSTYQNSTEHIFYEFHETNEGILIAIVLIFSQRNALD